MSYSATTTWLAVLPMVLLAMNPSVLSADDAGIVRLEPDAVHALIPVLSWDTEGGRRAEMNLLRGPVSLRVREGGLWRVGKDLPTRRENLKNQSVHYRLALGPRAELIWTIAPRNGGLTMTLTAEGGEAGQIEAVELLFPFNPLATATTVIPNAWDAEGNLQLPAILSAPDFGQMLLSVAKPGTWKIRLEGRRANRSRPDPTTTDATIDVILVSPPLAIGRKCILQFTPVRLPKPKGIDAKFWSMARRGWFNLLQVSAKWGDPHDPNGNSLGVWANNVISDPVSGALQMLGDQALLIPDLAPGVSAVPLVRHTLDWWLDQRSAANGSIAMYGPIPSYISLDANAAPLIAAWDYVEACGETRWLKQRIERLELTADLLAKCNTDDDGLVESSSTLTVYDVVSAGGKVMYSNALVYRAWRCMADLESKLGRQDQQTRYSQLADRLKADFYRTFYNPGTGWLAWWKTPDGKLHDYATPTINGLAIAYGLTTPRQGREILGRLWQKIEQVGFHRFDLGVPLTLIPIRKADYAQGLEPYSPKLEDGSDTFGTYLNGGVCCDTIYFLMAHYAVGEDERGDRILRAMLERQAQGVFPNGGGFQNGIVNRDPFGAEFSTWDGKTCGYEGYLVYNFAFLQAVLLRNPEYRARLFRPLLSR